MFLFVKGDLNTCFERFLGDWYGLSKVSGVYFIGVVVSLVRMVRFFFVVVEGVVRLF